MLECVVQTWGPCGGALCWGGQMPLPRVSWGLPFLSYTWGHPPFSLGF